VEWEGGVASSDQSAPFQPIASVPWTVNPTASHELAVWQATPTRLSSGCRWRIASTCQPLLFQMPASGCG
jgi:hypothetical protein